MTMYAKIIADSMSEEGVRLTTMELRYPRIVHAELMTHRVFSRNASSSRAIPVNTMIDAIEKQPAMPSRWGVNKPGMQDGGAMSLFGQRRALEIWNKACENAVKSAREMHNCPEPAHKQIVNRLTETFGYISVVVTSTYWANWFWLRDHKDADPTIQELAGLMHNAYQESTPSLIPLHGYHLPYVDGTAADDALRYVAANIQGDFFLNDYEDAVYDQTTAILRKCSAARCARVSYNLHDGDETTIVKDLELFERLRNDGGPIHASPFEHQAQPDSRLDLGGYNRWAHPMEHGNFVGWRQHRKQIVGEAQMEYPTTIQDIYTALLSAEEEIKALKASS